MTFQIEKEEIEALGTYLVNRPWQEVNQMVLMLQNLKPLKKEELKKEEDKKEKVHVARS